MKLNGSADEDKQNEENGNIEEQKIEVIPKKAPLKCLVKWEKEAVRSSVRLGSRKFRKFREKFRSDWLETI